MALCLGCGEKLKLRFGGSVCTLNILSDITNGAKLLSFEGYILQDMNGTYLTVKESE